MPRGGKRPGAGRKKKVGRPLTFSAAHVKDAGRLCALGATDLEIADFFEINIHTLYRWQAKYPEFCASLKAGKDSCDDRVERSLYHRAVGYSHDAVKVFIPAGARAPVYAPYREYVPPDTAAASLWLRNRRKDEWRDKQSHQHAGPDGGPITLEALIMARIRRRSDPAFDTVPRLAGGSGAPRLRCRHRGRAHP